MLVKNIKRANRQATIITEYNNLVLYHAIEDGKVFYPNMVRPSKSFWEEYAVVM